MDLRRAVRVQKSRCRECRLDGVLRRVSSRRYGVSGERVGLGASYEVRVRFAGAVWRWVLTGLCARRSRREVVAAGGTGPCE